MDATGDDPRPPSHDRGVRPASSRRDEAGLADAADSSPWLDLPDERSGRRRAWILAGAALPWVLLAVMVVRAPGSATEPLVAVAQSPTPAVSVMPSPQPTQAPTSAPSGMRSELGLADVAATAIPVVRAWLGAEDGLTIEGIPARAYGTVEHAVVEAIDHPGPGAAVASVLTVVTTREEGAWEVVRVAVPLRIHEREVRPAGEPWMLPAPTLTVTPIEGEPLHDADSGLIEGVGLQLAELYGEAAEVHGLLVGELWPLVADVTIRDPLDGQLRRQRIWIRADHHSMPVAGWFTTPPGLATADADQARDAVAPDDDTDRDAASTDQPGSS